MSNPHLTHNEAQLMSWDPVPPVGGRLCYLAGDFVCAMSSVRYWDLNPNAHDRLGYKATRCPPRCHVHPKYVNVSEGLFVWIYTRLATKLISLCNVSGEFKIKPVFRTDFEASSKGVHLGHRAVSPTISELMRNYLNIA